jgi:hypothetical protein
VSFRRGVPGTLRRRATEMDPYSRQPTFGPWDDAGAWEVPNLAIAPSSSFLSPDATRSSVETQMSVYADYDVDIRPGDRLTVNGDTWNVEAESLRWRSPYTGAKRGLEQRITRAEG